MRAIKNGIMNLIWYGKTLWKHYWWDYGFQLAMIDRMLADCERNWVKSTHYVGDKFTLGRIKVMRRVYARYEETWDMDEESKLLKKFLKMYSRNLTRLWD